MSTIDLSTANPEQLRDLSAQDLILRLKGMSDAELDAVFSSDNRSAVIAALFERMPDMFRADKAGSVATTTHWSITGGADGGSDDWTIRIADGQCVSVPGHDCDANLALVLGPNPFVKLITKSGNPVMMFMSGKIKAKGDLSMAANFSSLFDIPQG